MTPLLILGAGGTGVGALCAALARQAGHPVIALVRREEQTITLRQQGVKVMIGDACDYQALDQACQQAGDNATVISTMGGSQEYLAHRTLINSAEQNGIRRMVLDTSLGCGDSWRYLSPGAKAAFGQAVREKSLAESWLQTSTLAYAILRPGGLLNGPATGHAQLSQATEVHGLVMRADVAQHALNLAQSPVLTGQIFSIVEPGLKPASPR